MRKSYKFLIIIVLFLTSCYSSRIPTEVIKVIENEDDNLCMMQGIEYNPSSTRIWYWQCRLNIINQRINSDFGSYGYSVFYKREFTRIKKIIKTRIKNEKKLAVVEIDNALEEKEHNLCLLSNNMENENYFVCRDKLALQRQNMNFTSNSEYLVKVFDTTLEEKVNISNGKIVNISKDCIKYATNKEKLNKCSIAIKKIEECKVNINNLIIQRKIDDQIFCVKTSISKYPDSLSKFDNTTISAFGPKMNKMDLVNLREKELKECLNGRLNQIVRYKDFIENQCKINFLEKI